MIKNAIEIKKLHKIYDNKFEALKSIDLNIPKGSFMVCLDQMVQVKLQL